MSDNSRDAGSALGDSDWDTVEDAVRRLEVSWQASPAPELSRFVPPGERGPMRLRTLAELVKVDLEYRWKAGLEQRLEPYLEQWPELADDPETTAELLRSECLTRALFGAMPSRDELHARFGRLGDRIELADVESQATDARCGPTGVPPPVPSEPVRGEWTSPAAPMFPLSVGRRFGRYEVRAVLGSGGMGSVYRAYDHHLKRDVALKIPRCADPALLERFGREPEAAALIQHPNVCRIYDAGEIAGTPYIAMELIEGTTLAEMVKCERFDGRQAAAIARRIALALAKIHDAGIVHRDVKASNVMINREGQPVLMDFGLARPAQTISTLTNTGSLPGTLPYMSPEQLHGKIADARSDIYSLGVVLYEMLTGQVPGHGSLAELVQKRVEPPRPSERRPDLDADLDTICLVAMATRREYRFASARNMADALGRYLHGKPQILRPRASKRWRRLWLALAATVLPLGLVAIWLVSGKTGPAPDHVPEPATREVDRWVPTEANVGGICLSRDDATLWVAYCEDTNGCRIQKIDVASGKVLDTIPFGYQHTHGDVILSADDRYLYTTNYYKRYISRIDVERSNKRTDLAIGGVPHAVWAFGIDITPDKRRLVVALGRDGRPDDMRNDQVSIVDVSGGNFQLVGQVPLNDEPAGHKIGFSADSRFAYVVTRHRRSAAPTLYEVRLTRPCAVTRTVALPGGELAGVAVSGPLQRVFVSDGRQREIRVVDLKTFRCQSAFSLNDRTPATLAIDASRNLLAALCPGSRTLYFLDARNGQLLARVPELRERCLDIEFTHDRRYLAVASQGPQGGVAFVDVQTFGRVVFASDRGGEGYQIHTMGVDGKGLVRLTHNHASDVLPRWSPDGHRIAFVSDRTGRPTVCLINRDGTGPASLARTDPIMPANNSSTPLDWSPDGRRIAFISHDRKAIRVVDPDTGHVDTLLDGKVGASYAQHLDVCWMADDMLLFASENPHWTYDRDLFRLDPASGTVTQVTNEQGRIANSYGPTVSHGSRRIAVLRQLEADALAAGIFIFDARADTWHRVTPDTIVDPRTPQWFPDDRRLAFSARNDRFHHLYVVDVESGKTRQLTSGRWNDIQPDVTGGPPTVPDIVDDAP